MLSRALTNTRKSLNVSSCVTHTHITRDSQVQLSKLQAIGTVLDLRTSCHAIPGAVERAIPASTRVVLT